MPYPLFELATLLRVTSSNNDITMDTHRHKDVRIRLSVFKDFKSSTITVIMCDNGFLLLRYSEYGYKPIIKQLRWFQQPSKKMVAMAIDPSGSWLLCACQDSCLCIIPVLPMLIGGMGNNSQYPPWSTEDFTIIEHSSLRAPPTTLVWWHTSDGKDIGIIGTQLGELVFIDLILQRDVAGTSVEETIKSLELAQNDQCSSSYLLVHTTSGKKWSLLLELRQSMFFADTDLSQSFELLAGTTVPLESFLQSDEVRTDFTPAAFKQFSNFVMLSVQRAKGKSFVAAHDAENNIYKVFDGSIDNWLPLYVYQVLPNSKHILLTDRLMFSIIRREPEGQVHLSVISNQMSETSSPTTEGDTDAIVQMFSLPANEVILEVYKESFPPQYLINLERRHREEQMDSMGEVKRTTAANQVSETECHTVLDGCLVITNAAIYQCRPRISPEKLFLQLAVQHNDSSIADRLGIVLGLDINTLYEAAAKLRLKKGEFIQAMKLFSLSKCDNMKWIASFAKYGRMKEILTHLKVVLSKPAELLPNERKELSNLVLHCYVQQIVETKDKNLEMQFRQFLTDSFDYKEMLALNILATHGMYELMMDMAKARGRIMDALDIILQKGMLEIDTDTSTQLMAQGFSAVMSSSVGALLRCMSSSDLVHHLLSKPEFSGKYISAMKTCLRDLDIDTLLRVAEVFDPSKPGIRSLIQKAAKQSRKRTLSGSSMVSIVSMASESHSNSFECLIPRLETIVEFFIEVLLVLNHKRCELRKNNFSSLTGYRDDASSRNSSSRPTTPLSSPRRRSRVARQSRILCCGQSHAAAICYGDLYTWGNAHSGRLGHGEIIIDDGKVTPFRVETLHMHRIQVMSVACGKEHTLALCQQGVYAWGSSKFGQVGVGNTQTQARPVLIAELLDQQVVAVECGHYHSLALSHDHRVWSWGWGVHGQLGHGDPKDHYTPKHISSLDSYQIMQISAGCCHSAVLTLGGSVLTFGSSRFGQLGHGDIQKVSSPTLVKGIANDKIVMVTCGFYHMVVVSSNPQKLYTWGNHPVTLRHKLILSRRRRGSHALLKPDNSEIVHLTPTLLDNDITNRIKQISAGCNHTLIVTNAGELYALGKNDFGQLGVGTYRVEQQLPTLVQHFSDKPVLVAAAGAEFSVVMDVAGHTWVWGRADQGQLGLESSGGNRARKGQFIGKDVLSPVQLPGLPVVITASDVGVTVMDDILDDDMSNDTSDSDFDLTLPELSRVGAQSSLYSRQCISEVIQHLPNYYTHTSILRLCMDYCDWQSVADIYQSDCQYIYCMVYKLQAIGERHLKTTAIQEEATKIVCNCLRMLKESGTDNINNIDLTFLLYQVLWFWDSKSLQVEPLELLFTDYLQMLAYPFSLMLFNKETSTERNLDMAHTTESTHHTKSLLDIPTGIRNKFSTRFYLQVTSTAVEHITTGMPHKEICSILQQSELIDDNGVLGQSLKSHSTSRIPEERLWQEIQYNLRKDMGSKEFVHLSSNNVMMLSDLLRSQIQSNTYRYDPQEDEPNIKIFTCGHHFLRQPFLLTTLPQFESFMNNLPIPLPSTSDIMTHLYRKDSQISMACPNCVLSALRQLQVG